MTDPRRSPLLLVEDDDGDAVLFRELLSDDPLGAELVVARDVHEALAVTSAAAPVACVLDLGLPGFRELEALEEYRAAAPDVPVVVLTGRTDGDLVVQALSLGAQDFLIKGEESGHSISRAIRFSVERRRAEAAAAALAVAETRAAEQQRLESSLLGRVSIPSPELRWDSRYVVARDGVVGGDFLDCVELDDGTVRLVIGDVSGHGPDEAALGVALRVAWRSLVLSSGPQADVLPSLEQVLVSERHQDADFATVCDLTIPPERTSVVVRSAGHPPPILDGSTLLVDEERCAPLGVGRCPERSGTRLTLAPPARILLYTDGLFEIRRADGRIGELEELVAHVAARPSDGLDDLLASIEHLAVGGWRDDVAIAVLEIGAR
ncbi:PP2C family protein-serine/threonine phosphatase [Dermatobacter hominis]|uniref:PP2C family protein-serine/threonine phosphatase n=1 Tax=Dermatobacter hominis TaxID=2884263 RepID=UPI001D0FE1F5|nr:fused response regulator/phosphatase [Dermatobacter hominis]UDY37465.1 fused response regulator/phosphatase [Dermatobacter hominis]